MKNLIKNQKVKGSAHDCSWGALEGALTENVDSGRNAFPRLEKCCGDVGQLRGQGLLVDKLVLRFPKLVAIGTRIPRILKPFLFDDHEPRLLDFLEVAEGSAVGVEVGVMRHRLFRIEVAVLGKEDEGVESPSILAFETRQTHGKPPILNVQLPRNPHGTGYWTTIPVADKHSIFIALRQVQQKGHSKANGTD